MTPLTSTPPATPKVEAPSPTEPAELEQPAPKPVRARKPERKRAETPAAEAATAKVRVKVFPWGRVWIDGKLQGSAPPILVAEVSAGAHEIAVGHEKPIETKKVTLEADEEKTVAFDLEEK